MRYQTPNSFYSDLREKVLEVAHKLEMVKCKLLSELDLLETFLQKKRHATTKQMVCSQELSNSNLSILLDDINFLISKHNEKTNNFEQVKNRAENEIKQHYLSLIHPKVSVKREKIQDLKQREDILSRSIKATRKKVETLHAKISSDHRAADDLTKKLQAFLGRNELRFTVYESPEGNPDDKLGYSLLRSGKPVQNLSESEKSAIAFVYFLVHLNDGHFDKSKGIVVIDDPVSSLDTSSMYQAFAFLKSGVHDCMQSIILTHNFEFLRLLVHWAKNLKNKSSLYMIKNEFYRNERTASLDTIDPTLENFESEYQYLFKCIKDLQSKQNGTIEMAYPVPNAARKLWESFLAYHIPNSKSIYQKNEMLKKDGVDAQKIDAIYKFTNDQSHVTGSMLNPSLVPEAVKVISNILELMQKVAPRHFQILEEEITTH